MCLGRPLPLQLIVHPTSHGRGEETTVIDLAGRGEETTVIVLAG